MEIWKPVVGWESRYEVSSLGRVRSKDMRVGARNGRTALRKGRILKQKRSGTGRLAINLCDGEGRVRTTEVHVLVAAAFLGSRPFGTYVCHGDGNQDNNALSNLRYGTPKENSDDSFKHGTHATQKLTCEDVRDIRHCKGSVGRSTLAEVFGVTPQHIDRILSGRSWAHIV